MGRVYQKTFHFFVSCISRLYQRECSEKLFEAAKFHHHVKRQTASYHRFHFDDSTLELFDSGDRLPPREPLGCSLTLLHKLGCGGEEVPIKIITFK